MSHIVFRCLLFCSAVLSLNAALALPLADTLFTSSSYEMKHDSLIKASNAEPKFYYQVSTAENVQSSKFFNVDFIFKQVQLNSIFSSFINVLKLNQTTIFIHVESSFRRNILASINYSLEYLSLSFLKIANVE